MMVFAGVFSGSSRMTGRGTLEINRLEPGTEFVIRLPSSIEHKSRG
jgi:hypothetical protein